MKEVEVKTEHRDVVNGNISDQVVRLMHSFGNLFVHVSGEGKVDFRAHGMGSSWLGMIKNVVSGDVGCMKPYKGYDTCALDQTIDFLLNLELAPHMNISTNEEYVVTQDTWRAFVNSIKEECTFIGKPKPKYKFELKTFDGTKVVATVVIEPLCNEFVIGEYNASESAEYIGVIEDYDQPRINSCFIKVNGEDKEYQLDELISYRHRKYQPRKGDYLLRDLESKFYIILPQEDYSIH